MRAALVQVLLTLGASVMASACAPAPRTELLVRFHADEALRDEVHQIRVEVYGGSSDDALDPRHVELVSVTEWPLVLALVPSGRDATRRVRVVASALATADGPILAVQRVRTGFVLGRTLVLDLTFEGACRDVLCDDTTTCRGGACVSDEVDPGLLHDDLADAGPPDAGPTAVDAGPLPDAPPDAWIRPVRQEGEDCDPAAIASTCAAGLACTCTGPMGCAGAEPPRCWAMRDIGCGRPIDLTALAPDLAVGGRVELELDGAGATEIIGGSCGAPSGELVYLFRVTEPMWLNLEADAPFEYWPDCRLGWTWDAVSCDATEVFQATPEYPAFVFVQTNGVHRVRLTRTM
ncbi:MAG: hypothetical protein K1X94_19205 [Sandaracinaceae bacterium]|nr:hypothetical protein [Sandaracinaceae bacterium]